MSSIVVLRMHAVDSLQANITSKENALRRDKEELLVRMKLLQQEIEKGGTTGDTLTDLVLRAGSGHNDPAMPKLRALDATLKGKTGEFIAIRYSTEERLRYGGDLRSGDFHTVERVRIGILKHDTLQLRDMGIHKTLTLPVDDYLCGTWASGAWTVTLEEKPCNGDFFEWAGTGDQPPSFITVATDPAYEKDVLIGDAALRAALKVARAEEFFPIAAQRLHRLVLEPTA